MSGRIGARPVERVLIVSYEYPPLGGGGGVIFRDLAEELARRIEVTVLTSGAAGLPRREEQGGLRIVRTPVLLRNARATASLPSMLSFFPSSLWTGRRLLGESAFDLVHTSFAIPSGPSGLLLARRFGLPHLLSVHGGDLYDPSKRLSPHRTPLLKQTVRRVVQGSDRVVAQSTDTRRRTREIYGEREVDLVPLAVRPVPFAPASREALGLAPEARVLVTVGRLVARKGLGALIERVARLPEPSVQLVVVGDGPERETLEARARATGAAERVRFTGYVSDERKWQLLAASDLYVSTSLHEGFGIVFLEALECGLPVLCYDRGGQTDFLTPEVAELVPVDDLDAFEKRLLELLRDDARRRRMGEAGRRVAREFHVDRFADRYQALYAECAEARARRAAR